MDEIRKNAYRDLLYLAMVQIRCNASNHLGRISCNPWKWRRYYLANRMINALTDWLHNLAFFASHNFEGFDEERFWSEYEDYKARFAPHFDYYRGYFEQFLKEHTK